MTTCKDCVHFEACKNIYEIHGDGLSEESYGCDQFSNRSRFIELPFGVGDSYFEIFATTDDETAAIFKFHIDRIVQLKNAYGEPTEIFYEDRKAGRFQNALKPYNRRFRSREEAEQVLKE